MFETPGRMRANIGKQWVLEARSKERDSMKMED
jgi:hypothetical protein